MRTMIARPWPRRMALALGALALSAGSASAAANTTTTTGAPAATATTVGDSVNANLVYSTSGVVGTTGITGTGVISFVPVANSSVQTPSSLSLGTFVVAPLADGQTTVYDHTPFAISYATHGYNGADIASTQPLLTLTGFLNGKVSGADQSNVVATFDPITNPKISLASDSKTTTTGFLSLPSPERTLVPSSTFGGQSTAEGFLTVRTQQVPEPATLALFLTAGTGLALRRRARLAAR